MDLLSGLGGVDPPRACERDKSIIIALAEPTVQSHAGWESRNGLATRTVPFAHKPRAQLSLSSAHSKPVLFSQGRQLWGASRKRKPWWWLNKAHLPG